MSANVLIKASGFNNFHSRVLQLGEFCLIVILNTVEDGHYCPQRIRKFRFQVKALLFLPSRKLNWPLQIKANIKLQE